MEFAFARIGATTRPVYVYKYYVYISIYIYVVRKKKSIYIYVKPGQPVATYSYVRANEFSCVAPMRVNCSVTRVGAKLDTHRHCWSYIGACRLADLVRRKIHAHDVWTKIFISRERNYWYCFWFWLHHRYADDLITRRAMTECARKVFGVALLGAKELNLLMHDWLIILGLWRQSNPHACM